MAERLKAHGLLGEMAAEFAGTMILILFGVGVVAQVVATGGLSELVAPHSNTITVVDQNLTLDGLRLVWELNA